MTETETTWTLTPVKTIALLDLIDALPVRYDGTSLHGIFYEVGEEDRYGRAVDALDALGLLHSVDKGNRMEIAWTADLKVSLYSPLGFTPYTSRQVNVTAETVAVLSEQETGMLAGFGVSLVNGPAEALGRTILKAIGAEATVIDATDPDPVQARLLRAVPDTEPAA